ncbi:MAG TPA: hypothetical protein VGH57_24655 [Amycolatopsis sp.]|jgi:hypothetical protein
MRDSLLERISGRLLIQCRPGQAVTAAAVAQEHDTGLVLTGPDPEPVVRRLRDNGFGGPILCDAARYTGRRRVAGRRGIRPAWCRRQRDLGLLPLTDSGYLAYRDFPGLRTILRAAKAQKPPVVAMLPLAAEWFSYPGILEGLITQISLHGVPVAVGIEHPADPFAAHYVVRGFLELLDSAGVPVLLLRADAAALGALCHGAHAAATGTDSGLRHIYPLRRTGSPRHSGVSAFVGPLLTYHRLETLERLFRDAPDHEHLWVCECPSCRGRTPAALAGAAAPPAEAARHSVHAQLLLWQDLRRARTSEALASTWHEHCSHALSLHQELTRRSPAGLRSWLKVTEDPFSRSGIPAQQRSVARQRSADRSSG